MDGIEHDWVSGPRPAAIGDPPSFEEVVFDKLAAVEDCGPTVWCSAALEALHLGTQDNGSERSLPRRFISGTVSDDWTKLIGKLEEPYWRVLLKAFLFSISLIHSCCMYDNCQEDMRGSCFGIHHSKLVNSPSAGSIPAHSSLLQAAQGCVCKV